jgi:hypothetical protein
MKLRFFSSTSKQGCPCSQPGFLGYNIWVRNSDIELASKQALRRPGSSKKSHPDKLHPPLYVKALGNKNPKKYTPAMAAADVPWPPWWPTPGAKAYREQPTLCATSLRRVNYRILLLLLIIRLFSVWTTTMQWRCSCRQWCLQPLWAISGRGLLLGRPGWMHCKVSMVPLAWFMRKRASQVAAGGERGVVWNSDFFLPPVNRCAYHVTSLDFWGTISGCKTRISNLPVSRHLVS